MRPSVRRLVWLVPVVAIFAWSPERTRAAADAPATVYATLLGGANGSFDGVADLAVDAQGNAYVVGSTESSDFPIRNALDPAPPQRNQTKGFVAKFGPDGALLFSTFFGSRDSSSSVSAIAVDDAGAIYVAGTTGDGFPTKNPFQATIAGASDAFIAKLTADGASVVYASYLGGNQPETVRDLTVDGDGQVAVAGEIRATSENVTFPSVNAVQATYGGGGGDIFVSTVSANGRELIFSTLFDAGLGSALARAGDERLRALAVERTTKDLFLSGTVTFDGNTDAEQKVPFVSRFRRIAPSTMVRAEVGNNYGTLTLPIFYTLGQSSTITRTQKAGVKAAFAWLGLEIPPGALNRDTPRGLSEEPTVAREFGLLVAGGCVPVSPATTCDASAAFGVIDGDFNFKEAANVKFGDDFFPDAFEHDAAGNFYVAGDSALSQLHAVAPLQASLGGSDDLVIAAYNRLTFEPALISYFGGDGSETPTAVKVDARGNIYVAGLVTQGTAFPATPGAFQRDRKGRNDGFLVKISPVFPVPPAQ